MTYPKQSPDAVVVSEPVVTREHRLAAWLHYDHDKGAPDPDSWAGRWIETGETPGAAEYLLKGEIALALLLATIERNARPRWIPIAEALPDSDVWVLAANDQLDYALVQLEFTDDSEGHGEPYWAAEGGDLALRTENRRMKASLAAIHDALHAGDDNRAHELCECALAGQGVSQPNLTVSGAAAAMTFAVEFNRLAERSGLRACCVLLMPSSTVPGAVSLQLLGEVSACKVVEGVIRGKESTYMGDHASQVSDV